MDLTSMLGPVREMRLPQGALRYYDRGNGPALVFVHGLLANSVLWRDVIAELAPQHRCVALDLPLGGHALAMPQDTDLTPPWIARLVADALEALGLDEVTLIGNDTGGAICQILIAERPERIRRLVLTNCDAFEQFFPPLVQPFHTLSARFGEGFTALLARLLRFRSAQRRFMATVSRRRFDDETLYAYFGAFLRDPAVRRDAARFLAGVSSRYTLAAARSFGAFERPVLLVWGKRDPFFSTKLATRLQAAFPHATLHWAPDSRAFVPEDQPHLLAREIAEFAHAGIPA
jgi:pimeloyl-ACP methyl ester carboxylesterase